MPVVSVTLFMLGVFVDSVFELSFGDVVVESLARVDVVIILIECVGIDEALGVIVVLSTAVVNVFVMVVVVVLEIRFSTVDVASSVSVYIRQ